MILCKLDYPAFALSALTPEPLEIQTLRENLPTYSKPGPGLIANMVSCYGMTQWIKQISRRWVVHGSSLAHVPPGNALLCWGTSQDRWGGRMPTPLTLQMLWFQGRKTEVKQSLVEQVA